MNVDLAEVDAAVLRPGLSARVEVLADARAKAPAGAAGGDRLDRRGAPGAPAGRQRGGRWPWAAATWTSA